MAESLRSDASRVACWPDNRLYRALLHEECTDRGLVTLISVQCCSLVQAVPCGEMYNGNYSTLWERERYNSMMSVSLLTEVVAFWAFAFRILRLSAAC